MNQFRMKELREYLQKSQQCFSKELGIDEVKISELEDGTQTPDLELIAKLSDYFHVCSDYLLGISNLPWPTNDFIDAVSSTFQIAADKLHGFAAKLPIEDAVVCAIPHDLVPACFPIRLRRARADSGNSFGYLAHQLHISVDDYIKFETGEVHPDAQKIKALSEILAVSPDWLDCSTDYIDPATGKQFDPGSYKPMLDSLEDPIEKHDASLAFSQNISKDLAHVLNIFEKSDGAARERMLSIVDALASLDPEQQSKILSELTSLR